MADDDRREPELDCHPRGQVQLLGERGPTGRQRRLQGHAGDDAGQGDGQDHQQIDDGLAEEVVAGQSEREQRPKHKLDDRRPAGRLDRGPQGIARSRSLRRRLPRELMPTTSSGT